MELLPNLIAIIKKINSKTEGPLVEDRQTKFSNYFSNFSNNMRWILKKKKSSAQISSQWANQDCSS